MNADFKKETEYRIVTIASNIVTTLLLLAILPFASYYYLLLRLIVFMISGTFAIKLFANNGYNLGFLFLTIAILFNPIFPVYLEKTFWIFIDLVSAYIFIKSNNNLILINKANGELMNFFIVLLIFVPILGSIKKMIYPPCGNLSMEEKAKCEQQQARDDYNKDKYESALW